MLICTCRWAAGNGQRRTQDTQVQPNGSRAVKRPREQDDEPPKQPLLSSSHSSSSSLAPLPSVFSIGSGDATLQTKKMVGTCRDIVRSYVRPSSEPTAASVRPERILREAFRRCLAGLSSSSSSSRTTTTTSSAAAAEGTSVAQSLRIASDQLMSIRQDLTIQGIQNSFAATVYEYHARVCIEAAQLPELGQCLNQLKPLHQHGFTGDRARGTAPLYEVVEPPVDCTSIVEAVALRIAYRGLTSRFEDDIAMEVASVPEALVAHPYIQFAMKAVQMQHNAIAYMNLAQHAPCAYFASLLHLFVPKLRVEWLRSVVMGFQDIVPTRALALWLGFGSGPRSEESVTSLLKPVVGEGNWRNGMMAARSREKVLSYITEITESRSTSVN